MREEKKTEADRGFSRPERSPAPKRRLPWGPVIVLGLLSVCGCMSSGEEPKIGREAPAASFRTLDGSRGELEDFRGKVVLIRFWADWCRDCVREMPMIERFYRKAEAPDFTILALNVKQPRGRVEAFVRRFRLSFPVGLDEEGEAVAAYRVRGIPSHFVIDRGGILREVYLGPLVDESFLDDLLAPYRKQ